MLGRASNEFLDTHPQELTHLENSKHLALIKFKKDLETKSEDLPESIRQDDYKLALVETYFDIICKETPIYQTTKDFKRMAIDCMDGKNLFQIYVELIKGLILIDCLELIPYLEANMDMCYEKFSSGNGSSLMEFMR